jgi:hypothetical protein
MTGFWNLTHEQRFKAYDAIKAVDCASYNSGGGPQLSVMVARGKFGALCQALEHLGLRQVDLYNFPLGTDTPDDKFRHDRGPFPKCQYLIANFMPY